LLSSELLSPPRAGERRPADLHGRLVVSGRHTGRHREIIIADETAEPPETNLFLRAQEHCERLSGSAGEFPFGPNTEVYKVGGKMFAVIALTRDPVVLVLKLPPDFGAELRAAYPETVTPGYHMNKTHWNTIHFAGEPAQDELIELIDTSYELIRAALPRRVRDSLATT